MTQTRAAAQTVLRSEDAPEYGPQPAVQPLVALRALRRLIADPQRTDEVFVVIRSLAGSSIDRGLKRFCRLPVGRRVLAEREVLLATLLDRDQLTDRAAGTLADAYLSFVRAGNITADGLVDASEVEGRSGYASADHRLYGERLRDQHDLWHTLAGYGRDELGEVCLLAFTYAQTRNRGIGVMALVGTVKLSQYCGRGVFAAVWQAWRDGKRAGWLPGQDWVELLQQPLDVVRKRLAIRTPARYVALQKFVPAAA